MTVAGQLKIKGKPMFIKKRPNPVLLPHKNNKMKPQTVGGRTMGIVKKLSRMLLVFPDRLSAK